MSELAQKKVEQAPVTEVKKERIMLYKQKLFSVILV